MTDAIYDVWPIPGTHPVPYEPRLGRAKVEAEFARVTRLFTEASTEDFRREYADDIAAFARGLSDPRNAEVYLKDRPLIARMIGAEFDTETPGTRRIGMTSNVVPRLGGLFRDEIAEPDTQSTLGP